MRQRRKVGWCSSQSYSYCATLLGSHPSALPAGPLLFHGAGLWKSCCRGLAPVGWSPGPFFWPLSPPGLAGLRSLRVGLGRFVPGFGVVPAPV